MARLQTIREELDTDPDGRGYAGMDDKVAANDMNIARIDGPVAHGEVDEYITVETYQGENLVGRINKVANADDGDSLPLGASDAPVALSFVHICAAQAFLYGQTISRERGLVTVDNPGLQGILQNLVNCQAISNGNRNAILGFSQGKVTRGEQIGVGFVRAGDVTQARGLDIK